MNCSAYPSIFDTAIRFLEFRLSHFQIQYSQITREPGSRAAVALCLSQCHSDVGVCQTRAGLAWDGIPAAAMPLLESAEAEPHYVHATVPAWTTGRERSQFYASATCPISCAYSSSAAVAAADAAADARALRCCLTQ
jgi:hypothetical protein